MENLYFESVHLKGFLHFTGNPKSSFKGPLKRGNRPSVSIDPSGKATSCSILTNVEIPIGENKEVEIVLLNQLQLGHKIKKGTVLIISSPIHKIGEFTVTEHLGLWQGGKVP